MYCQTEEEFRSIPGLRLINDEDGCPIAIPYGRNERDQKVHLYFHGRGILGIYYEMPTVRAASGAKKRYLQMLGSLYDEKLSMCGEFYGLIMFRPQKVEDIPSLFFKRDPSGIANGEPRHSGVEGGKIDAEGSHRLPGHSDPKSGNHGPGLTWTRDADGKPICIPVAGG